MHACAQACVRARTRARSLRRSCRSALAVHMGLCRAKAKALPAKCADGGRMAVDEAAVSALVHTGLGKA